jgi:hypothetical protein
MHSTAARTDVETSYRAANEVGETWPIGHGITPGSFVKKDSDSHFKPGAAGERGHQS